MRQKIIAGNWKMNKTRSQAIEFVQDLKAEEIKGNKKVIVCAPFTSLYVISQLIEDTCIKLGAQNMHYEDQGAFTGEVSPLMLIGSHVEYVILGHSERREYFNETDELINKKVLTATKHGLKPILCVGENLKQREDGLAGKVITDQIKSSLADVEQDDMQRIIIAYEPIWAIGTGKTASSQEADEGCKIIRDTIAGMFNRDTAENVNILYGGSVNVKNANELFTMPNIDGGLVGGASLKAKDFIQIINFEG